MITSDSAWLVSPLASAFLVSPHRLDPPCMLGMFKTATPSRDRPLRSSGVPQHWRRNRCQRQGKALVHCVVVGTVLFFFTLQKTVSTTKYKMHTCSACASDAASSPRLLDFRSVSCRKQRWFLKWQIQNTTACSSFCSHEKVCFCLFVF